MLAVISTNGAKRAIAALFTKATGIEFDKPLTNIAIQIRDKLDIDCELIADDYLKYDWSKYDIIFINPDHEFNNMDDKLKAELKGPLFIYNQIFSPNSLIKGRKFWAGQIPIVSYLNKE